MRTIPKAPEGQGTKNIWNVIGLVWVEGQTRCAFMGPKAGTFIYLQSINPNRNHLPLRVLRSRVVKDWAWSATYSHHNRQYNTQRTTTDQNVYRRPMQGSLITSWINKYYTRADLSSGKSAADKHQRRHNVSLLLSATSNIKRKSTSLKPWNM